MRIVKAKKNSSCKLDWSNLLHGTLVRRYQRFKADIRLSDGGIVTAFCHNTGSMLSCCEPGRAVYISHHDLPSRKLKYTWEMIEMQGSLVGVNTGIPNKLVKRSIRCGEIKELAGYSRIRSEVKYGDNSRIDILLEQNDKKCFLEIKNCTLAMNGIAYFPDAVTARGLKHLKELQKEVALGNRAMMFYLVQRMDTAEFRPAYNIDPAYGQELKKAVDSGVEILAYDTKLDLEGISINNKLPTQL